MLVKITDKNDYFKELQTSGFVKLFSAAEDAIKDVELNQNDLSIPAINELRYAGYHIKNFLKDPLIPDEIKKAEGHCKRATYDAYEASILYNIREIKKFKDDYRTVIISSVVSNYTEYNKKITEIISFLKSIDKETKIEFYKKCKKHNDEIGGIFKILDSAREELNKLIKKDRMNSILFITSVLTVFIGLGAWFF